MANTRVFIDTSVWISYFKGKDAGLVQSVHALIEEDCIALATPVWIELLLGIRAQELNRFKRVLSALPRYTPTEETWDVVQAWAVEATRKGQRFGFTDLLIAALSSENQGKLYSLDSDFSRMQKLGWIQKHLP